MVQTGPGWVPPSSRSAHLCGPVPCCSRSPGGCSGACTGRPCLQGGPGSAAGMPRVGRKPRAPPRVTELHEATHLLGAGPWEAGRQAEVARCQRTRRSPGPGGGGQRALRWPRVRPCAPHPQGPGRHRGASPAAGVEPGPRLTWAAARTFWYKLLPWRGSGGPAKPVGEGQS